MLGFYDPFEDILRDPWFDLDTHMQQIGAPMSQLGTNPKALEAKGLPGATGEMSQQMTPSGAGRQQSLVPSAASNRDQWLSYARAPAIDVIERDKEFLISVDLPGVNKDEIKLNITETERGQKVLNVSGERKSEATEEDKERGYKSHSRMYGKFSRSLMLPENVQSEGIAARHENGVLRVSLPKRPEEPRKDTTQPINIQ